MSTPTVLLLGLSHVTALRHAQAERVARNAASFNLVVNELFPKHNPLATHAQAGLLLNESIEPALRQSADEAQPRLIVGSFWGNQHFFLSTANLPRRLDFVLPSEPDLPLDPHAEVIPYDLLYLYFHFNCLHQKLLIEATKRVSGAPLRLMKAPPPVFDFSVIPAGSSDKEINRLVAEHGLTPPLLRYKFWRLIDSIHQSFADETGVKVLAVPPETLQPDGFRRREYYSTDWIHANSAYGELVLKQCDALLAAEGS